MLWGSSFIVQHGDVEVPWDPPSRHMPHHGYFCQCDFDDLGYGDGKFVFPSIWMYFAKYYSFWNTGHFYSLCIGCGFELCICFYWDWKPVCWVEWFNDDDWMMMILYIAIPFHSAISTRMTTPKSLYNSSTTPFPNAYPSSPSSPLETIPLVHPPSMPACTDMGLPRPFPLSSQAL